jgi:hypothetical protein
MKIPASVTATQPPRTHSVPRRHLRELKARNRYGTERTDAHSCEALPANLADERRCSRGDAGGASLLRRARSDGARLVPCRRSPTLGIDDHFSHNRPDWHLLRAESCVDDIRGQSRLVRSPAAAQIRSMRTQARRPVPARPKGRRRQGGADAAARTHEEIAAAEESPARMPEAPTARCQHTARNRDRPDHNATRGLNDSPAIRRQPPARLRRALAPALLRAGRDHVGRPVLRIV